MDKRLQEEQKFTARNDYAFKKLFGTEENKDILIDFLSLATGIEKSDFECVEIQNTEIPPQFYEDKVGRLDIKVVLKDERRIDIEMQNVYFNYYPKRSIFYWCELFIETLKKGDGYSTLNKCIAINILNATFPLTNKLHSIYKILEHEEDSLLDDVFEIHFFDLTKLSGREKSKLEKWLLFIRTEDKRVREELAKESPMIAKANEVMNIFYLNDEERAAYLAASLYESDRASMLGESRRKGIAEGMAKGIAKGREEGREEGIYTKAIETARNCLTLKMPLETISTITGLSMEEIAKL